MGDLVLRLVVRMSTLTRQLRLVILTPASPLTDTMGRSGRANDQPLDEHIGQ